MVSERAQGCCSWRRGAGGYWKGTAARDLDARPLSGRGLRVLQRDARDQHGVAVGVQRLFAETVDAYSERKLEEE